MTTKERICIYVSILLLSLTGIGFVANAQTMPIVLNPNPAYWRELYLREAVRADSLDKYGTKAISGYKDALKAANDTIRALDLKVALVAKDRNVQVDRANIAEAALASCEGDKPKTRVGRWLRKVGNTGRDALAVIGGAVVTAGVIKLVWP